MTGQKESTVLTIHVHVCLSVHVCVQGVPQSRKIYFNIDTMCNLTFNCLLTFLDKQLL